MIVDEVVHFGQIRLYLSGHLSEVSPYLTNIPGYHFLVAHIMNIFGSQSLADARTINIFFGLLGGFFFWKIRQELGQPHAMRSVAQFIFFPLLYPYHFLVYTDVLSVTLVLAALYAMLCQRHVLAGASLIAAVATRQNDVIWAGFLALYALWPTLKKAKWRILPELPVIWGISWPYIGVALFFLAYWAWHGTIVYAPGQAQFHPNVGFHWGNPLFYLFITGLLSPLLLLAGFKRFAVSIPSRISLLFVPVVTVAIYVKSFQATNPLNQFGYHYYVHNAVLFSIMHNRWAWLGFGVISTFACCGLAGSRFCSKPAWLLFPFAILYLATSWLVEGRYAILPFVLWLALRRQESDTAERLTLGAWIILAQFLAIEILGSRFML